MDEMSQADWLEELEAQVKDHGFEKLIFFVEMAGDDTPVDIKDIQFTDGAIQVTFV